MVHQNSPNKVMGVRTAAARHEEFIHGTGLFEGNGIGADVSRRAVAQLDPQAKQGMVHETRLSPREMQLRLLRGRQQSERKHFLWVHKQATSTPEPSNLETRRAS